MNKSRLAAIGFVVALCVSGAAQDAAKPEARDSQAAHTKSVRLSGKVSADGTRFVEEANQRIWIVRNVDALKGFEGQPAVLRGRAAANTNTIQVLSIKGQESYTANWGDSAFRR